MKEELIKNIAIALGITIFFIICFIKGMINGKKKFISNANCEVKEKKK